MSCDLKLLNIFNNRRKKALFNVPPPRFDIVSPYNTNSIPQKTDDQGNLIFDENSDPVYYTMQEWKFELDMRRKAEVLLYNYTSSQTNPKLTKKTSYSSLIKNPNINNFSTYDVYHNSLVRSCNNLSLKTNKPTPSSSSGVPGPVINLINKPTIPLYNYFNSSREKIYSQLLNKNVLNFLSFLKPVENNVLLPTDIVSYSFATIQVTNKPTSDIKTQKMFYFNASIPFGVSIFTAIYPNYLLSQFFYLTAPFEVAVNIRNVSIVKDGISYTGSFENSGFYFRINNDSYDIQSARLNIYIGDAFIPNIAVSSNTIFEASVSYSIQYLLVDNNNNIVKEIDIPNFFPNFSLDFYFNIDTSFPDYAQSTTDGETFITPTVNPPSSINPFSFVLA